MTPVSGDSGYYNNYYHVPKSLKEVIITGGYNIVDTAFWGCTNLTDINIPNTITSIGNSAFRECSSLTNINIPNIVTSIGNLAFYRCSSLTSIYIPKSATRYITYPYN